MIENIEQAKEKLKRIVDFYKLNDENNYDYSDDDLISMKLVLEEMERLNKRIKELEEGFKAATEDLCEESTKTEKAIEYIKKHTYHDTPKKLQNGIYERGILLIKSDFDIEELLEILDKGEE